MSSPLVSVIVITYNQAEYIKKCLEGIFLQKTKFSFEIIISNDNSTDISHEIISDVLKSNNNYIVRYFNHSVNMGPVKNFIWTINQAKGKYIAICEGDDFWNDSLKLQKQVSILDAFSEYSFVCGAVDIIDENNEFVGERFSFKNDFEIDSKYLLYNNHISTCTVMLRKEYLNLDDIVPGINFLDKFLWLGLLNKGSCYFINDTLASYRIHSGGIYSKLKAHQKSLKRLQDYSKMKRIFPELKKILNRRMRSNILIGLLSSIKHFQFKRSLEILAFIYK